MGAVMDDKSKRVVVTDVYFKNGGHLRILPYEKSFYSRLVGCRPPVVIFRPKEW